jgi:hypothetical protein
MKHLLNNLSEEEKNSIREQHTGGMKIMTESFSKLLNSKLGDAKPLVNEQMDMEDNFEGSENMEDDFEGVEEVSHMSFLLQNADKNTATNLLKKYMAKHSQTVNFVAILRSEGVDLTDINFCECPNLLMVNLRETPNNFEETQGDCAYNMRGGLWDFDMGDEKPSVNEENVVNEEPNSNVMITNSAIEQQTRNMKISFTINAQVIKGELTHEGNIQMEVKTSNGETGTLFFSCEDNTKMEFSTGRFGSTYNVMSNGVAPLYNKFCSSYTKK